MAEADRNKYANVCKAVLEKFSIRRSVIVERHCFNIMIQDVDENITSFTKRLREQAVKCKFTATVDTQSVDLTDEFVRDRIVVGLRDNTARSRLLREKDLTLVSALELVTNIEIADEHVKRLTKEVHTVDKSHKPRQQDNWRQDNWRQPRQRDNRKPQIMSKNYSDTKSVDYSKNSHQPECNRCGRKHQKGNCRAINRECKRCHKLGHYANMCRARIEEVVCNDHGHNGYAYDEDDEEYSTDEAYYEPLRHGSSASHSLFLGLLDIIPARTILNNHDNHDYFAIDIVHKDWIETIAINNCNVSCKIDTGAQCNVLSESTLRSLGNVGTVELCNVHLSGYGGAAIPVSGKINLQIELNNITIRVYFVIVPFNARSVIGLDTSVKLELVSMDKRRPTVKAVHCEILDRHPNAVSKSSVPQHSQPHRDSNPGNTRTSYGASSVAYSKSFDSRSLEKSASKVSKEASSAKTTSGKSSGTVHASQPVSQEG